MQGIQTRVLLIRNNIKKTEEKLVSEGGKRVNILRGKNYRMIE
jgi:hypothetical protein